MIPKLEEHERAPVCKRCGKRHWRFNKCKPGTEPQVVYRKQGPVVVRAARAEKDWKQDKVQSFTVGTGGALLQERRPLQTGRVTLAGKTHTLKRLPRVQPKLTYPKKEGS